MIKTDRTRMGEPEVPGPLVGPGEIIDMLGVSRSRFRQIILQPYFPRPFQILQAGAIWLRSDVEAYIRDYRRPKPPADEDEQG
ncbi:transcriptional regulator, AlpA family [Micromonospora matsumotoense]|uniref:Transcriptional regulator, AlpA family n=2 Tax=Micromonosporaceae TaxID=28056 RepID=A0A1C4XX89_9ACTN|nr:transcriptional regulator, AlpA family [Micromonospora matsumotoense]